MRFSGYGYGTRASGHTWFFLAAGTSCKNGHKMESQDYETNRNLTLMFFLEKLLIEKNAVNQADPKVNEAKNSFLCIDYS